MRRRVPQKTKYIRACTATDGGDGTESDEPDDSINLDDTVVSCADWSRPPDKPRGHFCASQLRTRIGSVDACLPISRKGLCGHLRKKVSNWASILTGALGGLAATTAGGR